MNRPAALAAELSGIGEQLDELQFDLLLQARQDGASRRPDSDRVLVQARRAVEKAVHLLESLAADPDAP